MCNWLKKVKLFKLVKFAKEVDSASLISDIDRKDTKKLETSPVD